MENRRSSDPMIDELSRRMGKVEDSVSEISKATASIPALANHVGDFLGIVEKVNESIEKTHGELAKRVREIEEWKIRLDAKGSVWTGGWKGVGAPLMVALISAIVSAAVVGGLFVKPANVSVTSAPNFQAP